MAEIGELTIGAKIDTAGVQASLARMEGMLVDLGAQFDAVNADMERTEKSSKGISTGFLSITAATAAIYGLAKTSPQLAGSVADMQISMLDLSFTLGDTLAPAFETASDGLRDFTDWLRENDELVGTVGTAINDTLVMAIDAVSGAWGVLEELGIPSALSWFLENFGPETGLGLLAAKFFGGPVGLGVAGVTHMARELEDPKEMLVGETMAMVAGIAGMVGGPGLAVGAGAVGYAIGEGIEWIISQIVKEGDKQSVSINSSDMYL